MSRTFTAASAALLVALIMSPGAHAARPLVTDDARLLDKGTCQIEAYVLDRKTPSQREHGLFPACNPWGFAELSLGGTRITEDPGGKASGVTLQVKSVLRKLENGQIGLGFNADKQREAPVADQPLRHTSYLNLIASREFGDKLAVHVNLGGVRDAVASTRRGSWGIAAEYSFNDRWALLAEAYGLRRDKPSQQIGLRWTFIPDRLEFNIAHGFIGAGGNTSTIGLRAQF